MFSICEILSLFGSRVPCRHNSHICNGLQSKKNVLIYKNDKRDKCVCITLYSITSNNVSGSSLVLINARMILLLKLILKLYSNAATSTYLISQRDLPYRCKSYRMAF